MCALLSDVTAISRQGRLLLYVYVKWRKSQQKRCFNTYYTFFLVMWSRQKLKLTISTHNTGKMSTQTDNPNENSIATRSSSAILDCLPPASNPITSPIRISTLNTVIFTASRDQDLSNEVPGILSECFYHLACLCYNLYGISALVSRWSPVFIRRIIYKLLNVCPFDYTAFVVSGKERIL